MGKLLGKVAQRDKMVNFRVSSEEWTKLQQAARDNGARSIGEHLRNVIFTTRPSEDLMINAALERIKARLQEMGPHQPEVTREAL